jgi:hypothetical protein
MPMMEAQMKLPTLALAAVLSAVPVTTHSSEFLDRAFAHGGSVRLNLAAVRSGATALLHDVHVADALVDGVLLP